jgi:cytochrome b subunit of formate dehydrogenase
MILILHIVIAITGIIQTSYILVAPSKKGLRLSYALLALTLGSGTFLVVSTGTHILQACTMGLLYTGFVTLGIARTRHTLAKNSAQ